MQQPIKSMLDHGYVQLHWPRPLPHSHRARLNQRLLKATRIRDGVMSTGALDGAKVVLKDWDNWAPTQESQSSFDPLFLHIRAAFSTFHPSDTAIFMFNYSDKVHMQCWNSY